MVVPKNIGVVHVPSDIELRRVAGHRWRLNSLIHRPCRARTVGRALGAVSIVWRLLRIALPAAIAVDVVKGLPIPRNGDLDGSGGSTSASVPLFNRRVVGPRAKVQRGVEARSTRCVC